MLNRYRWYRIRLPAQNISLQRVIARRPSLPNSHQSFLKIESLLGSPTYRFLWRSKLFITQVDSNGTPSFQEVSTINFTDFAIVDTEDQSFLRIENPGRNIGELLNELEELVGLGFTCMPVDFENAKPTTVFQGVEVIKLIGLKAKNVVLGKDLVARMEFASKEGIIFDKLSILEDVPYKVDSASYELIYEGIKGQLAFFSNGTVKVSGQLAPKLIHLIEKDLAKL